MNNSSSNPNSKGVNCTPGSMVDTFPPTAPQYISHDYPDATWQAPLDPSQALPEEQLSTEEAVELRRLMKSHLPKLKAPESLLQRIRQSIEQMPA